MKRQSSEPERRFASLDEGSAYASISTRTLRRYIAAGRIRGYRVGPRLIRVDLNELDEVLLRPISTGGAA